MLSALCTLLMQLAQTRLIHGTRKWPLIAASFQTWRGSWASIAWDPVINTTYKSQATNYWYRNEEFNPAIADCRLQGTANSPSSVEMVAWRGIEPPNFSLLLRKSLVPCGHQTILTTIPSLNKTSLYNTLFKFHSIY